MYKMKLDLLLIYKEFWNDFFKILQVSEKIWNRKFYKKTLYLIKYNNTRYSRIVKNFMKLKIKLLL